MNEENKFNFSKDSNPTKDSKNTVEQNKAAIKKDAKGLFESITSFLSELLDFRDDTDRDATISAIKEDIAFKGATAWILICSIMVASVGLNANSTAVVIGAMLISPLMGPILGVGLSIAINDIDTLKKSLINLATMIVLSLLTAFLFFWLFPLSEDTSELLGRTKPDIRDVLIAFFGGLALIIARTKKGTIASVIFGVAIATALMPPLCTAGYGLAKANFPYFWGAMYLFIINTIFIALATFIVLKVLRFPMLKYANSAKRKRIARLASLLAIIVMFPAGWTFWDVFQESKFDAQIRRFYDKEIKSNAALQVFNYQPDFENQILAISFFNEVPESTRQLLLNRLHDTSIYPDLSLTQLKIKGNDTKSYDLISNAYKDSRAALKESKNLIAGLQKTIKALEEEILALNKTLEERDNKDSASVSFSTLAKDAKIRFSDLASFGYVPMPLSTDFVTVDTLIVVSATWKNTTNDSILKLKDKALTLWLKSKVKKDTIAIKR